MRAWLPAYDFKLALTRVIEPSNECPGKAGGLLIEPLKAACLGVACAPPINPHCPSLPS